MSKLQTTGMPVAYSFELDIKYLVLLHPFSNRAEIT